MMRALPAVLVDVLILAATFIVVSALAGLLGAANLGTALTFGTIAFAAVLMGILLKRA
jgi:ABC-type methionine transport system permease subunit